MRRITRRGVHVLLGGAAIAGIAGPGEARTQSGRLGSALDNFLRNMSQFGWSGQVVAVVGGEVALAAAYGWADRAGQRLMREETMIGVASTSKQFTASAVMTLVQRGAVNLDAPVGRYLPDAPRDKAALTLHQLMSHTAGMPGGDVAGDFVAESKQDQLARVYAAPLIAAPGSEWHYSNAGYNIVAAVIERVSRKSYEDYLYETLFRPAGLNNTGFVGHSTLSRGQAAHAYRGWQDQGAPEDWGRPNYRSWGSGSVFSTAADLYKWQQALQADAILTPTSLALLTAPHARIEQGSQASYGYGAFVEQGAHGLFIERSGDWERGYNAAWHRWPQGDLTLIVVCNGAGANGTSMRQAVQAELESFMRGERVDPPPEPNAMGADKRRRLAGEYRNGRNAIQLVDDGQFLWAAAKGQPAVELMLGDAIAERRESLRAAVAKTETLMSMISRDAYATALGADRPASVVDEYWNEWQHVTDSYGQLDSYEVLGATRTGQAARALVRLHLRRREMTMAFVWADYGAGSLRGTNAESAPDAPVGWVVQNGDGGALLAYDPLSGARVSFSERRNALQFGNTTLSRR